jgi:predicted AlkP superfamily pyrophosphatase or phosphodiesterase
MRSSFFLIPLVGLLFGQPLTALTPKERHVVLVSIDGFPAYMWNDPSLPVPHLRQLASEGASATAMTVSNPSITWINHTTLVTGVSPQKHGVLFNGLLVRQGPDKPPVVEQWVDKEKLVFAPTLYDLAHAAGLTSAESNWVAVTRAKTINWSFPELPVPEGTVEKEMIAKGLLTPEQTTWYHRGTQSKNIAWRDSMWTQAAIHMLTGHKPNLTLYHTLNTDAIHHRYGPQSWPSYTALAYADRLVGDLVSAVEKAGMRDRTTFFIATDHGFKKVQKYVYPNVILKQAGLARALGPNIRQCEAAAVTQGGLAFVYVTDPARKGEFLPMLKELFQQAEGIDRVIDGTEGPALGMPTPEQNPGMGDLILYAKAGYAFNNSAAGDVPAAVAENYAGTHGYPASDPELDGIFIASGAGIKPGVVIPRVSNLDVAPTIAKLLQLEIPGVEGRVLTEVLR